jgi:hypothetical protein
MLPPMMHQKWPRVSVVVVYVHTTKSCIERELYKPYSNIQFLLLCQAEVEKPSLAGSAPPIMVKTEKSNETCTSDTEKTAAIEEVEGTALSPSTETKPKFAILEKGSDDCEDTTQGVRGVKSHQRFVQEDLTESSDHEFLEEASGSSEADPLGIVDVPIDEDYVSGVLEDGMDGESETITIACVPILDEEDSDYDYDYDYEEESGFVVAEYDYEEDESILELDSSAESDSEDESVEDRSASASAADDDDDDDDPIFEWKNVTAMTRFLVT